jgi:hypothetical protein
MVSLLIIGETLIKENRMAGEKAIIVTTGVMKVNGNMADKKDLGVCTMRMVNCGMKANGKAGKDMEMASLFTTMGRLHLKVPGKKANRSNLLQLKQNKFTD